MPTKEEFAEIVFQFREAVGKLDTVAVDFEEFIVMNDLNNFKQQDAKAVVHMISNVCENSAHLIEKLLYIRERWGDTNVDIAV